MKIERRTKDRREDTGFLFARTLWAGLQTRQLRHPWSTAGRYPGHYGIHPFRNAGNGQRLGGAGWGI